MPQLLDHLHVVFHTLLDALCLDVVADALEEVHLLHQVVLYLADGTLGLFLGSDEEIGRIDLIIVKGGDAVEVDRVDFLYGVYLVVPPRDAQHVVIIRHGDVHRVALDAEVAALQVYVVAHIECIHQPAQEVIAVDGLPFPDRNHILLHRHRRSHTVDAGDGRHDYHVLPA